jgi:hypothetical protein
VAECLLNHSPQQKRAILVKWIVATYAQEPQFEGLVSVNKTRYKKVENEAVDFLTHLFQACSTQMIKVIATQGMGGVREEMNIYGSAVGESLSSSLVQQKVNLVLQRMVNKLFLSPSGLPSPASLLERFRK